MHLYILTPFKWLVRSYYAQCLPHTGNHYFLRFKTKDEGIDCGYIGLPGTIMFIPEDNSGYPESFAPTGYNLLIFVGSGLNLFPYIKKITIEQMLLYMVLISFQKGFPGLPKVLNRFAELQPNVKISPVSIFVPGQGDYSYFIGMRF